jgi:hypothetical protein|uniref:Uncharacterized protein n=1 Tax=viral metagenome TaxID=1070528 RepID=A0A6C0DUN5_9ZZZZ
MNDKKSSRNSQKSQKSHSDIDNPEVETFQNKFGLSKSTSIMLANLIWVFHTLVILFILIGPFLNSPALWVLHITFSISLLVHWYGNNNMCSLSMFEAKLRGLDYTDSFSHQFIAPIYDISNTQWSTLCYIITITLMTISIYYLYNSEAFGNALSCFREQMKKYKDNPQPFPYRLLAYVKCFLPLLILD